MSVDVDTEGVHAVANTDNLQRRADVVFVHGLGGKSHETWRHSTRGEKDHFFWPEELGKDLPYCGIWTVGYPAGLTWLGKPGMIIEKRAGNLSQKLANGDLGCRPIIFITHSMGGLVVKAMLAESELTADSTRKKLAQMTKGVVFCATPHRGSSYATAARALGKLIGGIQSHVVEMQANSESIDLLNEKFVEWHRRNTIQLSCYAENVGLFRKGWFGRTIPLGLVVPRASANIGVPDCPINDVDDDHLTIVKPKNRKHDVYAGVRRFIESIVGENGEGAGSRLFGSVEGTKAPVPEPKNTQFAFALVDMARSQKLPTVAICLVTDEPEDLIVAVDSWKTRVQSDPLSPSSVKRRARGADLIALFDEPSARALLLDELSKTPFSAYAYYCSSAASSDLTPEDVDQLFLMEPLIHRLSKRSETVTAVHTDCRDLSVALDKVVRAVYERFGRTVDRPRVTVTKDRGNRELSELAQLVGVVLARHLGEPRDREVALLFDHLATRIRYAENVVTGEKHTRDCNPLR